MLFGAVAARRETIAWLERRPLYGRTRGRHPRARAGERPGGDACARSGAEVVELPAIRIVPRLDAGRCATRSPTSTPTRWSCLTSPNGVRPAVRGDGRARAATRARSPTRPSPRSAPAPPRALAEHGVIADIVPESYVAEALVEALAAVDGRGPAGAGRARGRGPRRAPRRARRARRGGRRRRALRDRRASSPTPRRSRRRRAPTTSPSPRRRPSATWSRRSATASRAAPGSSRSAR